MVGLLVVLIEFGGLLAFLVDVYVFVICLMLFSYGVCGRLFAVICLYVSCLFCFVILSYDLLLFCYAVLWLVLWLTLLKLFTDVFGFLV